MNADSQPPRLCLVVPCYNEAERLPRHAFLEFTGASPGTRLVFVDDGSTDATRSVLDELAACANGRIQVIPLERNVGKAEAVRRGVTAAFEQRPQFVGFWDADLATPLDAVPHFLEVLESRPGLDIVIGSRVQLLGRNVNRRPMRHYTGRMFATAASMVLGLSVYDTQCGAKIFRPRAPLVQAFQQPFRSSWIFDVEILGRYVARVGREEAANRIYELPLTTWNDVPGSKIRLWHGVQAAWDLARIRGWTRRAGGGR